MRVESFLRIQPLVRMNFLLSPSLQAPRFHWAKALILKWKLTEVINLNFNGLNMDRLYKELQIQPLS